MAQYAHSATNSSRIPTDGQPGAPGNFLGDNLLKLVLISGLAYLVWSEKLSVQFSFGDFAEAVEQAEGEGKGKAVKAALLDEAKPPQKKAAKPLAKLELPAGPANNVTFCIDPTFAGRNAVPRTEVEASMATVRDYLKRFAPVAVAEMHKHGVPASITLAQGLLESNAGMSKLARTSNNHFGVKCFSNRCAKGHCVNFTDDTHKDFFVKYPSAWGSFRAHSLFLKNTPRYAQLFDLERTDYRAWAKGLAKAGYATDKKYAEKLIVIIQNLELGRYDKQ